jgi:serine/threonine protein kinase
MCSFCTNCAKVSILFQEAYFISIRLGFKPVSIIPLLGDTHAYLDEIERQHVGKMAEELLSAVSYLHGINIIHRDIKPANVLIGNFNQVKLADFGAALRLPEVYIFIKHYRTKFR